MSGPEQVFVVGTGRCGSTLVSNLLNAHSEVTSISEFFAFVTDLGARLAQTFPADPVSGEELWTLISTAWPRQNLMLQHDVAMPEVLYPLGRGGTRFSAATGVPAILQTTLPHLTSSPDAWFAGLEEEVPTWEVASIGVQLQRLFAWLMVRDGGVCWAERSGGGLRVVERLIANFPEARFVHIVRDGRDTALSMSRHRGFRMVFAAVQMMEVLGADPFESSDRRWEEDMPDDLALLLPERFSAQAFEDFETPTPLCGHYWSGELMAGLPVLAALDEHRLLTLRYEDLLTSADATARRLISFVRPAPVDEEWVQRAAATVRAPRSRWQDLPERERRQLEHACQPGFEALRSHGLWSPEEAA